jgi:redox-sensitive bicupin YhaK (pirin superfamily)
VNRNLYFFRGDSLVVDGETIEPSRSVGLKSTEVVSVTNGGVKGRLLVLQGKPIEEPVVQHGPFVVNYPGEIREVMLDYHQTQFGGWPWSAHDHVHERALSKFALHADGKREEK